MKRVHVETPDSGKAFIEEVLRSLEKASDHNEKIEILVKAFMTMRGWCYAAAALTLEEGSQTREEGVIALFKGAAMYYPEGQWRRFGELLYPKEGPMMARMVEAAKKNTGPR